MSKLDSQLVMQDTRNARFGLGFGPQMCGHKLQAAKAQKRKNKGLGSFWRFCVFAA
jgi:hypothetical protein